MSGRMAVALRPMPQTEVLSLDDDDLSAFSGLVGAIYDCALAPEGWPEALRGCALFAGAWSASLIGKGRGTSRSAMFYHDGRLEPRYVTSYFTQYAPLDPSTRAHLMTPIDTPISTGDYMDLDEFYATRFYREWGAPQRLVDSIMVPLERSVNWAAMLALLLHESSTPVAEVKRRATLIVPHVRRAALIGKVLEQRSVEADNMRDALNGLAAGMFLVDAAGQLVHANEAGHAMLRGGGPLIVRQGCLMGATASATSELGATFRAAADGDAALGTSGISVPLEDDDGERYVAHILPLTGGSRRRAGAQTAVAALFLHRATLDAPELPETVAKAYGLTQTELRVMMAIVHVGGVPETAEALGIAESTVKTHLARVFGKTGVNRQADLVKIVAGFAGPLAQ
jgi:DNA-binding CsgD family transcriptional regulator